VEIEKLNNEVALIHNNGKIVTHDAFPVLHTFTDQVYLREMKMSAGHIVMGAIHTYDHAWFLIEGTVSIKTLMQPTINDGDVEILKYSAPSYKTSKAGDQRVIYAHTNCTFVTVHKNPNNIKNIEELEEILASFSYEEFKFKTSKL
jgi:hypothetical protein